MSRIRLDIESLRLRGFRPEDRHAVAEGLRAELARLLAEPGAAARLAGLGSIPRLRLGRVAMEPGEVPAQVGVRTARAVTGRLKP